MKYKGKKAKTKTKIKKKQTPKLHLHWNKDMDILENYTLETYLKQRCTLNSLTWYAG